MKIKSLHFALLILLVSVLVSCGSDDKAIEQGLATEAFLVIDANTGLRNQEITFGLTDANDVDQSAAATFFINGEAIEGATFSSETEGAYKLYATYTLNGELATTQSQDVNIIIPRRKILLEAFTGVWCGNCPRKKTAVNELRVLTPYAAVVSIHGNSVNTGTDPLTIPDGMFIKDYFEIPGYPYGMVNREDFWYFGSGPTADEPFMELAGNEIPVSIAINSQRLGDALSIETSLVSEQDLANHRIIVYLVEDGILLDQVNYYNDNPSSPFYQMGNPIKDYEHSDVLREILTDPLGDEISNLTALTPITQSFTTTISSEFNPQNLKLVVAILNSNGTPINAQFANISENKPYE